MDGRVGNAIPRCAPLGLATAPERVVVTMPTAPVARIPARVSMLPAVVPLVAGALLAVVLHQWEFVAFTAMSPLMVLGQAVADRRATRRHNQAAQRDHITECEEASRRLSIALADEAVRRHDAAPDLGRLCAAAAVDGPTLWRRAAAATDVLRLRLGLADQPSDIEVQGGPAATARAVPLVASLPGVRVLGIRGEPSACRGLARSLVLQAAALHDPVDVGIVVLAPGGAAGWGWVRWLPHVLPADASCVATVGFDAAQISQRLASLGVTPPAQRTTLVVVDGADPVVLDALPDSVVVVWIASDGALPPPRCGAVATLSDGESPRLDYATASTTLGGAVPDLLTIDVATSTARDLARRTSRRVTGRQLPATVRWGELAAAPDRSSRSENGPSTEITLGIGTDGPVRLDLSRDGPHLLIAGTTGAGKSELLLTIVAELASSHRPDQLSLLLLDHKGGATLGPCARLPHAVGIVTDLDPLATRRTLLSIGAELRRREQLLAAAGVPDFAGYQRSGTSAAMPRLVIVVDEFAALVGDEPTGVAELVAIAQRGRSLGLHLILATQRPEGLVSADIRANTRIRICLGVTREQDSRDVIESPAAAFISRRSPGRAYLRCGPGELQLFQAARVTAPPRPAEAVTVTPLPDIALGDPVPLPPRPAAGGRTELDELIDAAITATRTRQGDPAPRPWLPPLPHKLELSTLPADQGGVAWGLSDQPREGRQPPLLIDVGQAATTLIIGAAGSGRSTAAVSMAVAMTAAESPEGLHIWGIDGSTGLVGRLINPGPDPMGWLVTIAIGIGAMLIVGLLIGGVLGFILAVIVAAVLVTLVQRVLPGSDRRVTT